MKINKILLRLIALVTVFLMICTAFAACDKDDTLVEDTEAVTEASSEDTTEEPEETKGGIDWDKKPSGSGAPPTGGGNKGDGGEITPEPSPDPDPTPDDPDPVLPDSDPENEPSDDTLDDPFSEDEPVNGSVELEDDTAADIF